MRNLSLSSEASFLFRIEILNKNFLEILSVPFCHIVVISSPFFFYPSACRYLSLDWARFFNFSLFIEKKCYTSSTCLMRWLHRSSPLNWRSKKWNINPRFASSTRLFYLGYKNGEQKRCEIIIVILMISNALSSDAEETRALSLKLQGKYNVNFYEKCD